MVLAQVRKRAYNALRQYATPQNFKRLKLGYDTGKTLVNSLRKAKRVVVKRKRKTKRYSLKSKYMNPIGNGLKASYQNWTIKKFPTYHKGKTYQQHWNTYEQAETFSFASSTGSVPGTDQLNRQKVFVVKGFGSPFDILALNQTPYDANSIANPVNLVGAKSGGVIYGGVKGSFEFTNQQQTNCLVTIYMCLCNRTQDAAYEPPETCWEASIDETAGFARGIANVNTYMPNATPGGKKFTDKWRIVQTTRCRLMAGETQQHYFNFRCNKTIDMSTLTNTQALKDVTISFLCTMRSVPVDFDATQTHKAATLIGYAPTKIVGVTSFKYWFKATPEDVPKVTYQNNLISGVAPTAVWELNEEDGKPVNIFGNTNVA